MKKILKSIFEGIKQILLVFGCIGIFLSATAGLYYLTLEAAAKTDDKISSFLLVLIFIGTIFAYYRIIKWWGEHHHIKKNKRGIRSQRKISNNTVMELGQLKNIENMIYPQEDLVPTIF